MCGREQTRVFASNDASRPMAGRQCFTKAVLEKEKRSVSEHGGASPVWPDATEKFCIEPGGVVVRIVYIFFQQLILGF